MRRFYKKELGLPEGYYSVTGSNQELAASYVELISSRIFSHMTEQQPYLRTEYSIHQLADEIRIPYYLVSYYLNKKLGIRFNDFVNQHRVNYFKQLVTSGRHRNLKFEGLAEKCGFNNRNSLTMAFKKFNGITPYEFIEGAKVNAVSGIGF